MEKYIYINFNKEESIKEAEKEKEKLENNGYILKETNVRLNHSILIYVKEE